MALTDDSGQFASRWHHSGMASPIQPVLVVMDYRGGERFQRCLDSIHRAEHLFSRIVISVTATIDSPDMALAEAYLASHPDSKAELICTGLELPTMQHQAFWVEYLQRTGVLGSDWIYWLAYDDEVRASGIELLLEADGSWPLQRGTAYFGPWAMRHEQADSIYSGPWNAPLESWTSFPIQGPTRLPVLEWIANQLRQPTYMQMSGSVCTFESFQQVRDRKPRKTGPMRIEMAVAAASCNRFVAEFPEPVSIIYGRSNSDRAAYGRSARKEDLHLAAWLTRYLGAHPTEVPRFLGEAFGLLGARLGLGSKQSPAVIEDWVVRGTVQP